MSPNNAEFLTIAVLVITFFTGWINAIITAVQDESVVLILLSIFTAPLASIYGLYLFF
jgi:hypothetical protein